MREVIEVGQFRRDVKLAQKRRKDIEKLKAIILFLVEGRVLPPRYKDHPLTGKWKEHRDLHIEPDWLLIYKIDGNDLHLVRTGTHSDLF
jgi:mRNA interferase YafQ